MTLLRKYIFWLAPTHISYGNKRLLYLFEKADEGEFSLFAFIMPE